MFSLNSVFFFKPLVKNTGEGSPDKRSDPEKPELLYCPTADKKSRSGTPGRVHGSISHRDTDQMNKRKTQTDGNGRKALDRST